MEIRESFAALADERMGKITLTRHAVDIKPTPTVTAEEILALRERLKTSRAPCSHAPCAPMSVPWKIGNKAGPGPMPRPGLLIRLVESYLDTVERLAGIT